MKRALLAAGLMMGLKCAALGNGGAWQVGVPGTGNASSNAPSTNVTIEEEKLKIDLHSEHAAVEVHYRMRNNGPKVEQDFFFPIERWPEIKGEPDDAPTTNPVDLEHYQVSVDGKELKSSNAPGAKTEAEETVSGGHWRQKLSTIKSWKKSAIPFERNQVREVTVAYNARYAQSNESVSDDEHIDDATFAYSLSPAATWQGPIGKGKIEINILHPEPADVTIAKPKQRFRKLSDTHYEWSFENLKPSLADDIRIIAHSKYDRYSAGMALDDSGVQNYYTLRGAQYFLDHTDYIPVASSTLAPDKEHKYDVANIRRRYGEPSAWAEGVAGDGLGESITLQVKRALPLYGILIRSGYFDRSRPEIWWKNNRVAALEITLNDEHTFTESIPDERLEQPYLMRVRSYSKSVHKIKMVIKGVHRGTDYRDTCISLVELRAPLTKKPAIQGAR